MNPTQTDLLPIDPISKDIERIAYEAYWLRESTSFSKASSALGNMRAAQPSKIVSEEEIRHARQSLERILTRNGRLKIEFKLRGFDTDYPANLLDAESPIQAFYYQGNWSYIHAERRIAIIGSRDVSSAGVSRTKKLARLLVDNGVVVLSGLAEGVDTAAHTEAIEQGGKTIAILGTAITDTYPKQNKKLQKEIGENHLLISQIPILRYSIQDYRSNRQFFPERNATMSALAQGTVIVEAADRSGTLTQARAALKQGRKLFILDSCFENSKLSWPHHYQKLGAIRVKQIADILNVLEPNQR